MTRRLATVRDYDQLHRAVRERVDELGVSRETIDRVSGLPDGYASKLLAPVPIKGLGRQSLGPMLQALGLVLVVEVIEEQPRISESPLKQPYKRHQRAARTRGLANMPERRAIERKLLRELMRKIQRKAARLGGIARAKKMTPAARRRSARKAGLASAKARREARVRGTSQATSRPFPAPENHPPQCAGIGAATDRAPRQ